MVTASYPRKFSVHFWFIFKIWEEDLVVNTAEPLKRNHEKVCPENRSQFCDSMPGISNKKSGNLPLLPKRCCRKLSIIYLTNKRRNNTTLFGCPPVINDKLKFWKGNLIACRVRFIIYSASITEKPKLGPRFSLPKHFYGSWHESFVQKYSNPS
jgi:hypothetical protein